MTPVTQADKDRIDRFLQQDLTNGLAEEHLWRLVADVRAEAYEAAAMVAASHFDLRHADKARFASGSIAAAIRNLASK